ncbi:hypothetical protein GEMRC1_007115 [Eukaryota sp. GEM-RC1]
MHDAVRDQIHAMCKSYKVESFVEPFGKRRADVVVPSSSDKLFVVDVVSVDVCRKTSLKNAYSATSPLDISEQAKQDKYKKPLIILKHVKHVEYELCPFVVELQICQFWIDNPIFPTEVANAIARLPKSKAAGPSGILLDLLKAACKSAPEASEDLANYFQQLVCLKDIPPIELTATRLIAVVKPGNGIQPDGILPIAVGESISP